MFPSSPSHSPPPPPLLCTSYAFPSLIFTRHKGNYQEKESETASQELMFEVALYSTVYFCVLRCVFGHAISLCLASHADVLWGSSGVAAEGGLRALRTFPWEAIYQANYFEERCSSANFVIKQEPITQSMYLPYKLQTTPWSQPFPE